MAKKNSLFPIVLIAAAAIYYFAKLKSTGENLKINLYNIGTRANKGFLNLPKVILIFQVQNITNNLLTLNGIVGDIYVNGVYFANVNNLATTIVKPLSSSFIDVEVQASILDSFSVVKDFLLNKGKKFFLVTGNLTINVNGILVPIKIEKKLL
jgi:LEA14-like dessication related protein